jgi:amidohydrolase
VTVLGTPAEEGGCGKIRMIESGCFKDIDIALMVHPFPLDLSDGFFISRDAMTITYTGKASHAAAFPWEGVNALDAAVAAYNGISMLRQQIKPTWRIHGVITNGGAKPNIIPEKTELEYYLRAPTNADLAVLKSKVEPIFHSAAQSTGCQVNVASTGVYSNLISNSCLEQLYVQNAEQLGVKFSPTSMIPTGSTDMGNVSYIVPSIHPMYKIGTTASIHSREFAKATNTALAHERTLTASKAIAGCAIDVLTTPGLLQTIKDCFKQQVEES